MSRVALPGRKKFPAAGKERGCPLVSPPGWRLVPGRHGGPEGAPQRGSCLHFLQCPAGLPCTTPQPAGVPGLSRALWLGGSQRPAQRRQKGPGCWGLSVSKHGCKICSETGPVLWDGRSNPTADSCIWYSCKPAMFLSTLLKAYRHHVLRADVIRVCLCKIQDACTRESLSSFFFRVLTISPCLSRTAHC